jgi:hypothetical protein
MKKYPLIVFLLLFSLDAAALGIGVVPDRIVFSGGEERALIVNPNNLSIDFRIKGERIECSPSEGSIGAEGKAAVMCKALEGAKDGVILVETSEKGKGGVGVIPAVAIKAEIAGEDAEQGVVQEKKGDGGKPLVIEGDKQSGAAAAAAGKNLFEEMPAEMITIALLTVAILFVLGYSEVKNRKNKKNTTTSSTCASSRPASQDDQSSAEASASPHQPLQAPLHDAQAGNQQP